MVELIQSQRQLQAEADEVVEELQLDQLLGSIGRPIRVGSSAMGLMVRRDIDITVVCRTLDEPTLKQFSELAALLMQKRTNVSAVRFRNDCGAWNVEPEKYPDGLYLGLTVQNRKGAIWTLDIWVIDQPTRQPDLAHLETLLPRITQEHRRSILQIKWLLADRPKSTNSVPSAFVYEAVIDSDVRTIEQFDAWLNNRQA